MQSPLLNLNKAFSLIVDHESQRNLAHTGYDYFSSKVRDSTALFSRKEVGGVNFGGGNSGQQSSGGGNSGRSHYDD